MADMRTTIEIIANDRASETINKVKNEVKGVAEKTSEAKGAFGGLGQQLEKLTGLNIQAVAGFAGLAGAISAVIAVVKKSIEAYNEYEQKLYKLNMLVGAGGEVDEALNNLRNNFGSTRREATELMGDFATFFKGLGYGKKEIIKLSSEFGGLAKDMSKFYGIDLKQATQAIQMALVGNTRALKHLGIVLNDFSKLEGLQKTNAILDELRQKTVFISGSFEHFNKTLAGSLEGIKDATEDLLLKLGEAFNNLLAPIIEPIRTAFENFVSGIEPYLDTLKMAFSVVGEMIGGIIQGILTIFGNAINVMLGFINFIATAILKIFGEPISFILKVIKGVVEQVLILLQGFYNAIVGLANKLGLKLKEIELTKITDSWQKGIDVFDELISKVKSGKSAFEAIRDILKKSEDSTKNIANNLYNAKNISFNVGGQKSQEQQQSQGGQVVGGVSWIQVVIQLIFNFLEKLKKYSTVVAKIMGAVEDTMDYVAKILGPLIDEAFANLGNIFDKLTNSITSTMTRLFEILAPFLSVIFDIINDIVDIILPLSELLTDFVFPVLKFVLDIINIILRTVSPALRVIIDIIIFLANKVFIPIINFVIDVMNGVGKVINAIVGAIEGAINWVIDQLNNALGWAGVKISRVSWGRISEISHVSPISNVSTPSVATSNTQSTGGGGASGLSVVKERDIYLQFYNYGVLTGFKNDNEFFDWLRTGIKLAEARSK
jgi:phage-related protein